MRIILSAGIISFAPRELAEKIDLAAPEPSNKAAETPAGIYVMRSNDQVCCELKDTRGTQFTVMSNGETSINKPPSQTDETSSNGPLTSLVPRYFGVYQDGSGFELLRQSDVNEFLCEAEKEPSCAVLKSPVEGVHQATGITVLKPYSGMVTVIIIMINFIYHYSIKCSRRFTISKYQLKGKPLIFTM